MDIEDFISELNEIAPPEIAEDFDEKRIGLAVEGNREIKKIACALDATEHTVSEAISLKADILVVHHPPIWDPLAKISGRDRKILKKALEGNLNIFAMHTNFDHAESGINDALAELLGLTNTKKMSLGVVGECRHDISEISELLGGNLRIYGDLKKTDIIAVVGGSGFDLELINEAKETGADAFISAELKYNVFLESSLPLIESTHYALESVGMKRLSENKKWTYIEDKPLLTTIP
ncbi:dinuclear metal center YbgI/SA1388 family protein [Methanomicrobium sp. W14]|uniref:Nif3-like dinuclear metal center hexameric protein n=1 Tax=Methanomicrobium sp. W14 TaxID=2817839 RepID=UPI001AE77AD5|nr:Nif3-like dinuclear metal center hexameric protein [Methanomicrobium sp. W14]MBP2132576.1 dinuclear metal center YbgI/SA1388 family protein [Methanomicrobium sp. W14]